MLTAGKLRDILRTPSIGDDMPVLIRTRMIDGSMQADDINDIGVLSVGRRDWANLIAPGIADVKATRCLVVSCLEPIESHFNAKPRL